MWKLVLLAVTAISLLACGGSSDSDEYTRAVELANAKEAEARTLGSVSPCDQVQQCGLLTFVVIAPACGTYAYAPYSLVSPSANAANAASVQQQTLAQQASALAPPSSIACAAVIARQPPLVCAAGKCAAAP